MSLRIPHKSKTKRRKNLVRMAVVLAIVAGYGAYWALAPATVEITRAQSSSSSPYALLVTLHNPNLRPVSGNLYAVYTGLELPVAGTNRTGQFQSVPGNHPFFLLPETSIVVAVPMNAQVVKGIEYEVHVEVDGGAEAMTFITLS